MDEPLSNLDARLRGHMRSEIAGLQEMTGVTTVYVTHDQIEAMTMGDRVAVMRNGELQQLGPPRELYDHPANTFVAGFIGSPAMNFFDAKVEKKGASSVTLSGPNVPAFELAATNFAPAIGANVKIGVRPEHLAAAAPTGFKTGGAVELVERLGETSYAYIQGGGETQIVAEVRGRDAPSAGDVVALGAPDRELHLFDEAGERITAG
jgi:ABC-type sugar transport system ATPase subunit